MTPRVIKWRFIVERSPWRGGWWERLLRSVKEPLRKVLGKEVHLALARSLYSLPDEVSTHEGTTRQRYLYKQKLLTHFWQRWREEYLRQLSVGYKWVCEQPAIKIEDVLLISEDNVPRGKWSMGRVERLVPGKDGLVRTATLKTQKGRLQRPVERLHRLQTSTTQFVSDKFGDSGPNSGETPLKKSKRRWRRSKL